MSGASNGGTGGLEFFFLPYPWRAVKRYRWAFVRDTYFYEWAFTLGFCQFGRRKLGDL